MLKSILLAFSCLFGVNRAVQYDNAVLRNGSYYYSNLTGSNRYYTMLTDNDNQVFTFQLNTPIRIDSDGVAYNTSDDSLVSDNDLNGGSAIFYAWSNLNFNVSYDYSTGAFNPVANFDSNSQYICAYGVNTDDENLFTQALLNDNNSVVDFYIKSTSQYVNVYYFIEYNDLINDSSLYESNYSYCGLIQVDTTSNNGLVSIPYLNNSTPNYWNDYVQCVSISMVIPALNSASYTQGYTDGYQNGNVDGYQDGYSVGRTEGESAGYDLGFIAGSGSSSNFINLFFAVADTPLYFLKSLFSVEILGVKVYTVVLSLITTMVMIWVVRKFVL